jgi:hypothetical protein
MSVRERKILWKRPALQEFISRFNPSLEDYRGIIQAVAASRDHPDSPTQTRGLGDSGEAHREPINKENIPELCDLQGDLYLTRFDLFYIFCEWVDASIFIVHVDDVVEA